MTTDTAIPKEHLTRLIETPIGWFALTREASDLGPFPNPALASEALTCHIKAYKGVNRRSDQPLRQIHIHDSSNCLKDNCGLCAETLSIHWSAEAVG